MIASTLWNGQDAVDQAFKQTLSCTDKNQLAGRDSLVSLLNDTSAFTHERRSVEIHISCRQ